MKPQLIVFVLCSMFVCQASFATSWWQAAAIAYSPSTGTAGYGTSYNPHLSEDEDRAQAQADAIQDCGKADCKVVDLVSHVAGRAGCIAIALGKNKVVYTQDMNSAFDFHENAEQSAVAECSKHTSNCKWIEQACD